MLSPELTANNIDSTFIYPRNYTLIFVAPGLESPRSGRLPPTPAMFGVER